MDEDDFPVQIFGGRMHSEVVSFQALLESAGIETSLRTFALTGVGGAALYVRKRDEDRARQLLDEFRRSEKPTE